MPKENRVIRIIKTIKFKFFLVSVLLASVLICFYISLSKFNTTDPDPEIELIEFTRAREFAGFTVHIETGLFIRNFSVFDMIENRFVVDMVVWFIFDPTEITMDTIGKFSFENGKIIKMSPPDIKITGDKTFVKYDVLAEFKSDLEYHRFPLEDHRFAIVLVNNFVSPQEAMFDVLATDFVVSPEIFVSNWKIKKLETHFGVDENILNQIDKSKKIAYPKATFVIDFVKAGIRKTFIIFVPIFIVFLLSLFSFFLGVPNIIGRTTLSVSALSALLGYRFVIENMMPKVGYFTTTDHVYIILLLFSFFNFIFQVILTRMFSLAAKNGNQRPDKRKIEVYTITKDVVFVVTTLLSTIFLCIFIV